MPERWPAALRTARRAAIAQVRLFEWTAVAVTAVVLDESNAHGAVGGGLQPAVDGRKDTVALVDGVLAEATHQVGARHLGHVRRLDVVEDAEVMRRDDLLAGRLCLCSVDVVQLLHLLQYVAAAALRRLGIGDRVVVRGRLRQSRQCRRLRQAQLVEALAEVGLGRGRHAIAALAKEDDVQIGLQDLLFGELMFHAVGDEDFLQLAPNALVEGQEHVPGGLHRDGAGALRVVARGEVDEHRAQHAAVVEAVVAVEALVFRGNERVAHRLGNVGVGDQHPTLLADLCDQLAAAAVDAHGHRQVERAHGVDGGQRRHH